MQKLFENKYGYFDDATGEYVVKRPDTPRPWVNILSNGTYGMTISEAGSGYSWRDHAQFNRLTRWDQDLTRDNWGKYVYIRDDATGDFWSPAPKPTCVQLEDYACRHGLGYTTISGKHKGIETDITYFVDAKAPVEVWMLKIKNASKKDRRLSLYTYLEWCLGTAPDAAREFEKLFIETEYDKEHGAIFAGKLRWGLPDPSGRPWARPYEYTGFHAMMPKPVSYTCDQAAFIGQLGETTKPRAVVEGRMKKQSGRYTDGISALQGRVRLKAGQEKTVVFLLGAETDKRRARAVIKRYKKRGYAEAQLEKVKRYWERQVGRLSIETPDKSVDLLANRWLPYQAISCRIFGRSAYYQTGGAYGYRDQLQDSLATLPLDADLAKEHIRRAVQHQFSDGSTVHWWHPITDEGGQKQNSDDLLWMPFVTLNYLKETGDYEFLKETLPFLDKGKATVREHCEAAINQVLGRPSKRGLPTMIEGDWNDGLSCIGFDGHSESVWLAEFLYGILVEWMELLEVLDDAPAKRNLKRYNERADKLKKAINKYAWDGEWYIRATYAGGKLGSKSSKVARIFLNAQTWALMYGIPSEGRRKKMLKALDRYLYRDYGPLLFTPAFSVADPGIGHLSQYAPALRENGGLYTHAGCWAIIAEAVAGDPDQAYKVLSSFNPILRGKKPDLYKAEPYVTPGNVDGPESPFFGRGGWTWYTGSAAWMYRSITDYILGVRATHEGLVIDPAIPRRWKGYRMTRRFRGATYEIEVTNRARGRDAEPEIEVNGEPLKGKLLPQAGKGERVKVKVTLRESA
jgi:cellobiose phosphorylase